MKNLFLLLPLLAVPCAAQPKQQTPQFSVDPAAKVILDSATATYSAAKGLRFNLVETEKGEEEESRYSVAFQKPNLMRVDSTVDAESSRLLYDGKTTFILKGTSYERDKVTPKKPSELWLSGVSNTTGFLLSSMLEGRSPLVAIQETYKRYPNQLQQPDIRVTMAQPTVVAGVPLHGVRIHFSSAKIRKGSQIQLPPGDVYLWFNPEGLLTRIYSQNTWDDGTQILIEQLSDQQLNPTFAPDTFKFNTTGLALKVPPPQAAQNLIRFDTRLKVGAKPFAFSAKDINGRTISPANYKGKVLLLDFWATWCGPCVRGLPEIKSVYAKYHSKGFEVVGISIDEDTKTLSSFIKRNQMAWPQIYDGTTRKGKGQDTRVYKIYGVRSIPFLLLVGKDGKIAAVSPRGELEAAVKRALAAKG